MAERILIWGAGAIGGSVGAWLKRAGHDITSSTWCPSTSRRSALIGLRITGPVEEFTVAAPAFLPGELAGIWQRIFLAVKAQHTEAATRSLTPHLAQDGYVSRCRTASTRRSSSASSDATARSAPSSTSAPTGWRPARSCSATAVRSCWGNSTAP